MEQIVSTLAFLSSSSNSATYKVMHSHYQMPAHSSWHTISHSATRRKLSRK